MSVVVVAAGLKSGTFGSAPGLLEHAPSRSSSATQTLRTDRLHLRGDAVDECVAADTRAALHVAERGVRRGARDLADLGAVDFDRGAHGQTFGGRDAHQS